MATSAKAQLFLGDLISWTILREKWNLGSSKCPIFFFEAASEEILRIVAKDVFCATLIELAHKEGSWRMKSDQFVAL